MPIPSRVFLLVVAFIVSTVGGVPLEALQSLVIMRSTGSTSVSCVGIQLQDHRVITSAACDVNSLDSVAFVAGASFLDDVNGLIRLALQPPQELAINTTTRENDTAMASVRVLRLNGDEAPFSLNLLPPTTSVPAVLSEDATASIIEVDPATQTVSVVDQVIYVDRGLCLEGAIRQSVCVLPLTIEDRVASLLDHPTWRFLVQHDTTTGAHALLGIGREVSATQEANGFRLFSWLLPSYSDETRNNGPVVDKITRTNEFVAGIRSSRTGFSFCSGSLIASRFVLTAAHCTTSDEVGWVAIGATKTEGKSGEMIQVQRVIRHPKFPLDGQFPRKYDIALLELDQASSRTPVRLGSDSSAAIVGKRATAFGYGTMGSDANISKQLRSVELKFEAGKDGCSSTYGDRPLDESIVCTRTGLGEGLCSGDSGGPLVLDAGTDSPRVVAIHGGGKVFPNGTCAFMLPSWGLRVEAAADFIRSTIDDARTPRPYNPRPGHVQA